jgi:hypothetical protein
LIAGRSRKGFRVVFQSGKNIQEGIDAGFYIKELVYHRHPATFHQTIATLETSFLIPHGIIEFVEDIFYFFEGSLRIAHIVSGFRSNFVRQK